MYAVRIYLSTCILFVYIPKYMYTVHICILFVYT